MMPWFLFVVMPLVLFICKKSRCAAWRVPLVLLGAFAGVALLAMVYSRLQFRMVLDEPATATVVESTTPRLLRSTTTTSPAVQTGKVWIDDFPKYINEQPASASWLVAESPTYYATQDEAEREARRQATAMLARVVSPRLRDGVTFAVPNSRLVIAPPIPALPSHIDFMLIEPGQKLIVDRHIERVDRPYGQVWRCALLIDASPQRVKPIVDSYQSAVRKAQTRQLAGWGSLGAMALVIILLYLFLNAATKGYFVWRLRAAAMLVAIVAVLMFAVWVT